MLNIFNKKETNEYESNYRKTGDTTLVIIIGCIVTCAIIGLVAFNVTVSNACKSFEKTAKDMGYEFALKSDLLPTIEET